MMRNAVGFEIPEGYTLKNYKQFKGMDFQAWEAVIYRKNIRVGIAVDRGNGGGAWGTWDTATERELFYKWMASCPNAVAPNPQEEMCDSEEWALTTLGIAAEITKEADRASKTKTLFLLDDQNPAEGWGEANTPYDNATRAYLLTEFPDQKLRVWIKGKGWVEINDR